MKLFVVVALAIASLSSAINSDPRAVELNSISNMVFKKGEWTTAGRTRSVRQLQCVGGGACGSKSEPDVIQCTNTGVDYATGDPNWKCTAELEQGLRLGSTDVICEGFASRDDPFILRGSCSLEYKLLGTPHSESSSRHHYREATNAYYSRPAYSPSSSHKSGSSWLNWIIFMLCVYIIGKYMFSGVRHENGGTGANNQGQWPGGGGWGTGGGGGGGFPGFGGGYHPNDCGPRGGNYGGFWQGMGVGGGLGYLFGRNNNAGYHHQYYQPRHTVHHNGGGYVPQRPPPSPPSPATHTSTGYGTTGRRG